MNDLAYRLALQEAIKRKFYGHDKLKSKHVPQYAISAERQYSQTFVNLHREVEKEVQKYVPKIVRLIEPCWQLGYDAIKQSIYLYKTCPRA